MAVAKRMREEGLLPSGRNINPQPRYFIGVADLPINPADDWQPTKLLAKIAPGTDFANTQIWLDTKILGCYVSRLQDFNIPRRLPQLIGLAPLAFTRQVIFMLENLFGTIIPDVLVARLDGADAQRAEGRCLCIKLIEEIQYMSRVADVHLMGHRAEAQNAATLGEGVFAI